MGRLKRLLPGARCSKCGYKPPVELAGAIFMGPGGLHRCPTCGTYYCNDHAKRISFGDVTMLNCPKCDEQLKPA
jgi:Na+-translocating ferredoxin:NAD+ oxidoreductase RNF subunit RnfB